MKKYFLLIPFITLVLTCSENNNLSYSQNSPPKINEITVNPSQPISGQVVTLNAIATDSDGDDLTYSWSVSAGQLSSDGIGNPIQWTTSLTGGEINVICVVSDGKEVAIKNILINVTYNFGKLFGYVYREDTNEPARARIWIESVRVETADVGGYYEFDNIEIGSRIITVVGVGDLESYTYRDTIQINGGDNYLDIYIKNTN